MQFGTATVAIAGEPGCEIDDVNLTITQVRFNMDPNAIPSSPGWTDITLTTPRRLNLAQLRNGASVNLGKAALLPGHYAQARLVFDSNTGNGLVNSIVARGSSAEVPLITQSPTAGGALFSTGFDIANGQALNLTVDFDACRSIVPNNGDFLLRPVTALLPANANGISGVVDPALLGSHVRVSAQQNGVIIRATLPDPITGAFLLARLEPGNYDVVIVADDHATAVISGVPAANDNVVVAVNTAGMPIATPVSASGSINASLVLVPASAVEAPFGSATQTFSGGPSFTAGARMSNLADGKVQFLRLPASRPVLAVWKQGQPLVWDSQIAFTPGQGVYSIVSSAPNYVSVSAVPYPLGN